MGLPDSQDGRGQVSFYSIILMEELSSDNILHGARPGIFLGAAVASVSWRRLDSSFRIVMSATGDENKNNGSRRSGSLHVFEWRSTE